jgi:hypothetical protein
MRQILMLAAAVLIAAVLGLWSATAIVGKSARDGVMSAASMDVLSLMRGVKNLPEQDYDAF